MIDFTYDNPSIHLNDPLWCLLCFDLASARPSSMFRIHLQRINQGDSSCMRIVRALLRVY